MGYEEIVEPTGKKFNIEKPRLVFSYSVKSVYVFSQLAVHILGLLGVFPISWNVVKLAS